MKLFFMQNWVKTGLIAALLTAALLGLARGAQAHGGAELGGYALEFGWLNEPPLVGQPNGVALNFSQDGAALDTILDVSGLQVEVRYGGQSKALELQPLNEESTGEFVAPFIPTRPGIYSLHISGTLAGESVETDVEPEEVLPAESAQFPQADSASAAPALSWIEISALALGLAGTLLGLLALVRKPRS